MSIKTKIAALALATLAVTGAMTTTQAQAKPLNWVGPAILFSAYGLLGLLAALATRETWGKTERDEVEALERALKAEGSEPARRRSTENASGS